MHKYDFILEFNDNVFNSLEVLSSERMPKRIIEAILSIQAIQAIPGGERDRIRKRENEITYWAYSGDIELLANYVYINADEHSKLQFIYVIENSDVKKYKFVDEQPVLC